MIDAENTYQTLIADLPIADAHAALAEALDALLDMGVIRDTGAASTPTGRTGFPPGDEWTSAIVECDDAFLQATHNAVVGTAQRAVVDPGSFAAQRLCPACQARAPLDALWHTHALAWVAQDQPPAPLRCAACGEANLVRAWAYDPPVGFGTWRITFWNWPSINREFIHGLEHIVGAPIALIEGQGDRDALTTADPPRDVNPRPPR